MRRRLPILLISLALFTTACGGGDSDSSTDTGASGDDVTTTEAEDATTTTEAPVDTAKEEAQGKKINVVAADFPAGWTGKAKDPDTPQDTADDDKLNACIGLPPDNEMLSTQTDSDDFSNGGVSVSSSVNFAKTKKLSDQAFEAITGDKVSSCFITLLTEVVEREASGAELKDPKFVTLAEPEGGDRGFALRFTATLSAQGQSAVFAADIIGIQIGRMQLGIQSQAFDGPTPEDLERQLIAKMVTRAEAA